MTKRDMLLKEVEEAPEPMLAELLDFLRLLKAKTNGERMQTAIASESSLKKDWLSPEEDAAWGDL